MKYLSVDLPEAWGHSDPNIYRQNGDGPIEVLTSRGEWQRSGTFSKSETGIFTLEELREFYRSGGGQPWRTEWLGQEDIDAILRTD